LSPLEDCINPGCSYELTFDEHALGCGRLSTGHCPGCGGAAIFCCPSCDKLQLTRAFIRNLWTCVYCDTPLRKLTQARAEQLETEARHNKGMNSCVRLSPREIEVVKLLAEGRCNKEIAASLSISVHTVETYRARIMIKVDAHSVVEIVHYAIRRKILSLSHLTVI
jgi:DNA-binding CsgD family transcriptional regulator